MQIVILADERQKAALTSKGILPGADIKWIEDVSDFQNYFKADAFIDLLFKKDDRRINMLQQFLPKPVIINSVENVLDDIYPSFVRINAWNSFLDSETVEGSASIETRDKATELLALFNKKIEWLPDEPGFVTARVISMIINEAYISLEQGVSSKKDIDTAMKLGTNYPYGPFEWADKIGLRQIADLLNKLAELEPRYQPAPSLLAAL
ncbi:MAG: 3-hydroxyacyl-CoA dehydrogenase family protein [Flavisolibacter sp.]